MCENICHQTNALGIFQQKGYFDNDFPTDFAPLALRKTP